MPIQIINSGVKLTPEPNTISTVVARNETGVICRVSASLPTRRTRRFSHQGLVDLSDGGRGIDRQTDGGDGGQASAGQASSPYDMTSVFGLKVGHSRGGRVLCTLQVNCVGSSDPFWRSSPHALTPLDATLTCQPNLSASRILTLYFLRSRL